MRAVLQQLCRSFDTHLANELHRTQTGHTLKLIEEDRSAHPHLFYQFIYCQRIIFHLLIHDIEQLCKEGITRYGFVRLRRFQTHQTLPITLLQMRTLGKDIMHPGTDILRFEGFGHIVIRTVLQRLQTTLNSRLGG